MVNKNKANIKAEVFISLIKLVSNTGNFNEKTI